MKIELHRTTRTYTLDPPQRVEQRNGNGLRVVMADTAELSSRPGYHGYVTLSGRTIRRDGTTGPRAVAGWFADDPERPPLVDTLVDTLVAHHLEVTR